MVDQLFDEFSRSINLVLDGTLRTGDCEIKSDDIKNCLLFWRLFA